MDDVGWFNPLNEAAFSSGGGVLQLFGHGTSGEPNIQRRMEHQAAVGLRYQAPKRRSEQDANTKRNLFGNLARFSLNCLCKSLDGHSFFEGGRLCFLGCRRPEAVRVDRASSSAEGLSQPLGRPWSSRS